MHVYVSDPRRADALYFAGLQHSQQFRLQPDRHVGNFVEEQRALVRQLEASDPIDARVREGAFDVPEELAFGNPFRQSSGIHGHERLRLAIRERVQPCGGDFLAGAMFAREEDGGIRGGHPFNRLPNFPHAGRITDERRRYAALQAGIDLLQALTAAKGTSEVALRSDGDEQPVVVRGFSM